MHAKIQDFDNVAKIRCLVTRFRTRTKGYQHGIPRIASCPSSCKEYAEGGCKFRTKWIESSEETYACFEEDADESPVSETDPWLSDADTRSSFGGEANGGRAILGLEGIVFVSSSMPISDCLPLPFPRKTPSEPVLVLC